MTLRRWVFSAVLGAATVYVAYPYVTLYRLANAVSTGDAATLSSLVAWESVREGVKEDICDAVTEVSAEDASREGALRPFGYSFVRGVAGNLVDANITPEALVSATRSPQVATDPQPHMRLNWAFFDGPKRFDVAVGMPGETGPDSELRVQMAFQHGKWMVTRAWLTSRLLMAANSRT